MIRNLQKWTLMILGVGLWGGACALTIGTDSGITKFVTVAGALVIGASVNSYFQNIEEKEELQRRIDFAKGGSKDADED